MWERYANSEQGFCIEYDAKKTIAKIGLPLFPVYYDEKSRYDAKSFSCLGKEELTFTNFLIKNKVGVNGEDWYSQREWRIIGFRKNLEINETEDNGECIQIIKPTRIILGRYVLENVRMRILNWKAKEGNEEVIIEQR